MSNATKPPADDELWLWWDTEATDLLDGDPVALEAGWMVTTPDLRQLTPLRSRYLYLAEQIRYKDAPPWPTHRMADNVLAMHRESGLTADWLHAREHGLVVCDVTDLDALVWLVDVVEAMKATGFERVRLAGAGVSHYDQPLLSRLGSTLPGLCEYGTADTTRAAIVARMPKVLDPDPDDGLQIAGYDGQQSSPALIQPHRVIADIRASWATARSVQAITGAAEVLRRLVELHDGPRDDAYRAAKG